MNSQLDTLLAQLLDDIRSDPSRLPTLYWLHAYALLAAERQTPRIRWSKLSGYVSRTAREFGINGLDHAPGRALLTDYPLFQAVSIAGDPTPISDPEQLRALDMGRSYEIELRPEYGADLQALAAWSARAWDELRRVEGESAGLTAVLARWAPEGRAGLLPALIQAQEASGGWLPREVLVQIGQALRAPLSEVYGVATYYAMLYTHPVGKKMVRVCDDVTCYLAGSCNLLHRLHTVLGVRDHQTTPDDEYTLEIVPCMGHCDAACAIQVNELTHEHATPENIVTLLSAPEELPTGKAQGPRLLKNIAAGDLHTLNGFRAQGGFAAFERTLTNLTPDEIIAEVKASGLVGRGGAAFPTGLKWELTRKAIEEARTRGAFDAAAPLARERSPGYVVCNADESETGTFKDRILLERHPFQVLEGILIAARAIGASYGYIYIRGEYPLAYRRFRAALEEARAAGYLGNNIRGSGLSFELEIRRGAGAYECGEETALFESIEGKRGEPRVKPPFPVQVGLFNRPTVINNVETLANIPFILANGAVEFRKLGTEKSPGTRLVCLSGQVVRGGVYEIPMGTSLRQVIYDLGGGLQPGRELQAVLVGGVAGTFLTPDEIDVPLAFEALSAINATFGSGAIVVLDDSADMREVLARIARFFRDEYCGKCFPCQIGTQRQLEIMERFVKDTLRPGDRELLLDTGIVMKDASLCGLGQFAATAILSAFDKNLVR